MILNQMCYHNTISVQDSAQKLAYYWLIFFFEEHLTVVFIFILGPSSHFGDGKGYIKPP